MMPRLLPLILAPLTLALAACEPGDSAAGDESLKAAAEPVSATAAPRQEPVTSASDASAPGTPAAAAQQHQHSHEPPALAPEKPAGAEQAPAGADDVSNALLESRGSIFSPEPEVDFGEVIQGEKREHTFIVGNRGDDELGIRSVNPTCGCTVAQVKTPTGEILDPRKHSPQTDLMTLKPGEQAEVMVVFDSKGQAIRRLQKYVQVISSDHAEPALKLTMSMSVTAGIEVEPNPLQFGEIARGQTKTLKAFAKFKQVGELKVLSVDPLEHFDVKWEPGTAPDGTGAIAFEVTVLPTAPVGYLAPTLVAKTDNDRLKQIQLQLYVNVKSYVVFDTGNQINKERLDFEVIPFGEGRTRTVEVTNGDPELPYQIDSVTLDTKYSDLITAETETVEEGRHYKIHVTTAPELDARFFRGVLKIQAQHKDIPVKEIHFHGWVKKS